MAKAKRKSGRPTAPRLRVLVTHHDSTVESQRLTPRRLKTAAKAFPGALANVEFLYGDGPEALDAMLPEADVVLMAGNLDLGDLGTRAPRLRWLQSMSAGVEKIIPMVPPGVALTNASGVHGPRGGEYVFACLLMLNSRVPQFVTNQQQRLWKQIHSTRLKGKTVVIFGVGAIGGEAARLAKRFGMRVIGVTRSGKRHRHVDQVVRPSAIAKVLPEADFVAVTLPLTPETRGLLGRRELDWLPRHAGVVNVGRSRVMDYDVLAEKLRRGELSGAVLEVFDEEPLPETSPLWSVPNLIISPHCGVDDESVYVERCLDIFLDNLRRFKAGRALRNLVDPALGY
ncbi:MAG TPA: D-2-hydroxyacid dehydrogenase [Stellaceae bacterium]|nr:D-2-hydroxyacid dehydrogenase [Stellaceae bacterium]